MRKISAIILICIVCIASLNCVKANSAENSFEINFNGVATGYTSVISNDTQYLPMRKIFEMMDANVFYRSRDNKVLVLSRDGDTITHTIGDKTITKNGMEMTFENPSLVKDNETYISADMISAVLCPERIFCQDNQLIIEKRMTDNEYHKVIKEVLDFARNENFYPERFERYKNYHAKYPEYSMQEVIFRVNLGLDNPFYENVTTIAHPYELLVLVNKYNQLPAQFSQYNLVNMNKKYTLNDGKEYLLAGVAYENYIKMWDAAKKEGLLMTVVSAYRTEDYQRSLYNRKVKSKGLAHADVYSARAGHSEHQTGLAMDIGFTETSFERTAEFAWLQNHAHEYGYIMRYPKNKEWITGYAYEPWHYRFVGTDVAKIIHDEGITFEEYCAKYLCVNEFR